MKIVYIILGLILMLIAFDRFQHLLNCKDDTDLVLCLFTMICAAFGGICIIADTITGRNESK